MNRELLELLRRVEEGARRLAAPFVHCYDKPAVLDLILRQGIGVIPEGQITRDIRTGFFMDVAVAIDLAIVIAAAWIVLKRRF